MLSEGARERSEANLQKCNGALDEPPAITKGPFFPAFPALVALPAVALCRSAGGGLASRPADRGLCFEN
jgi:hypothetical protein